jgi:uncharacterized phage protein gp47/JayE
MAFVPRTFEEIRDDMISFVRMQTTLTDFEVGSAIRTIIEVAALEDDEQYFQMVQLLDAFRLSTASGQDLDERVAEFNLVRLQPEASTGEVIIQDGNLVTSTLDFSVIATSAIVFLESSAAFPTAGFPVNARIGEGTVLVEEVQIAGNNTGTGQITLNAPLANDHSIGERFSVVSGSDKALTPGIRVQVPASGTASAIIFVTTESGTLVAGNFESTAIRARAEVPGAAGNIGTTKISQFASSAPFNGAQVTNHGNFAGGRDIESDSELRDRARASIQSLSKGTVLALKEGVLGVTDPVTGQRVVTANLLESFITNEVIVYVDDGTGFTPDQVDLLRTTLTSDVSIAGTLLHVATTAGLPDEGFVVVSPNDISQTEILEYSGVNHSTNTITLVTPATKTHSGSGGQFDEVALIDLVEDSAESGEKFFGLASFPVVRSSYRLWVDDGSSVTLQVEDADYFINRGTGQIEFIVSGVAAGSKVAANYSYYTALLHQAQKVVDGDPTDPVNFPGLRAAGIRVIVETPVTRRITVHCSITAKSGFQEADLTSSVQEAIESYINGLAIGADVIIAEIIRRAMSVTGVADVVVSLPTSNVVILENELPRPVDVSGNSLVTVN